MSNRRQSSALHKMLKSEMRTVNFSRRANATHRYHSIIASLVLLFCIPIFVYHTVPSFTHATDEFMKDLATRFRGEGFCTKEVGSRHCCALLLEAAPCVDECRKENLNMATWTLTREYEECVERCERGYREVCGKAEKET
jgi:hypothetical protein